MSIKVRQPWYLAGSDPSLRDLTRAGYNIIEKVRDYVHAVARIGDKGSGILISLPTDHNTPKNGDSGNHAVLLTTSFVLHSANEANGEYAVFLEMPVTGAAGTWPDIQAIHVHLRPDRFFTTSLEKNIKKDDDSDLYNSVVASHRYDKEDVEELGYAVVACDLFDEKDPRNTLRRITPLELPIIIKKVPVVKAGDTHLLVIHQDDKSSRFQVGVVIEVHTHHCVYEHHRHDAILSSGGPVFDHAGEFIGLQHQVGENSFCLFIKDVVSHLFDTGMLGACRINIWEDEEDGEVAQLIINTTTTSTFSDVSVPARSIYDPLEAKKFDQCPTWMNRAKLRDFGCGNQLVEYKEFERYRKREAKGAMLPETLKLRTVKEIWNEWYTNYRSLVLLLHAFPYNGKIVLHSLRELTSHELRHHIPTVASLGGIGIVLHCLDLHPFSAEILLAGVSALARLSMYEGNKDAIVRCDGIAVISSIMYEFPFVYEIQQWATCALLNLTENNVRLEQTLSLFLTIQGVHKIIHNLRVYPGGRHLQRWSAQLLSNLITAAVEASQMDAQSLWEVLMTTLVVVKDHGKSINDANETKSGTDLSMDFLPLFWRLLYHYRDDTFVLTAYSSLMCGLLTKFRANKLSSPLEYFTDNTALEKSNRDNYYPEKIPAGGVNDFSSLSVKEQEYLVFSAVPQCEHTSVLSWTLIALKSNGLTHCTTEELNAIFSADKSPEVSVYHSDKRRGTQSPINRGDAELLTNLVTCLRAIVEDVIKDDVDNHPHSGKQKLHEMLMKVSISPVVLERILVTIGSYHLSEVGLHAEILRIFDAVGVEKNSELHSLLYHQYMIL